MILFEYSLDAKIHPSQQYFLFTHSLLWVHYRLYISLITQPMNATLHALCILLLSISVLATEDSGTPFESFFILQEMK